MLNHKLILFQFILILINFVIKTKGFAYEEPSQCNNPNGRSGLCVSIYDCQSLLNVFKTRKTCSYTFVHKSACAPNGQGRRPYVCCTSDTDFIARSKRIIFPDDVNNDITQNNTSTTIKEKTTTETATTETATTEKTTTERTTTSSTPNKNENYAQEVSLLPKPPKCGPVKIGFKIYGGEETALGEFPWLANLEYKKRNSDVVVSVCAGNIINHKYILTAAHCIKGDIEIQAGQLVSARVGDHNTESPVDCNDSGCLDAFQRVGVATVIVHAGYNTSKDFRHHNDIALVRTDQDMHFSVSVAPICLPDTLPQATKLTHGMKLTVAGWGHTGLTKSSPVKLKVEVPYVDACPLKVAPEQLCAGGEFKKDSCSGDSGGGLVRLAGPAWIIEGIVSYGRGCGLERPAIYTRVSSYIPWIRANVEP